MAGGSQWCCLVGRFLGAVGLPLSTCACVGGVGRRAVCCFHSAHMIEHTGPSTVTLSLDGALMALQVSLSFRVRVCGAVWPSWTVFTLEEACFAAKQLRQGPPV